MLVNVASVKWNIPHVSNHVITYTHRLHDILTDSVHTMCMWQIKGPLHNQKYKKQILDVPYIFNWNSASLLSYSSTYVIIRV